VTRVTKRQSGALWEMEFLHENPCWRTFICVSWFISAQDTVSTNYRKRAVTRRDVTSHYIDVTSHYSSYVVLIFLCIVMYFYVVLCISMCFYVFLCSYMYFTCDYVCILFYFNLLYYLDLEFEIKD